MFNKMIKNYILPKIYYNMGALFFLSSWKKNPASKKKRSWKKLIRVFKLFSLKILFQNIFNNYKKYVLLTKNW